MLRTHLARLAFAALLAAVAWPSLGLEPVNKSLLGGVAIDGYDPVAYFTDGKATEGKKELSFEYQGATWRFATPEHRDAFAKDPTKYAPQYGGYCAYAVSKGYTADVDPKAFTLVDGKLYLNYNEKVQETWRQDKAGFIARANESWPKLLGSAAASPK